MKDDLTIVYPLSLVMGFVMLMDASGIKPSNAIQGFLTGVILMYLSCLLVFFTFIKKSFRRHKNTPNGKR